MTSPVRPPMMRVSLAFIDGQVNVWLRFGRPARAIQVDRVRRVAMFRPGTVCCRVRWASNGYGSTIWQLMVLQAGMPSDTLQTLIGVTPGARILLRAEGERQVRQVFGIIDRIDASGIDPCRVPTTYWAMVQNRLSARLPLPDYTEERREAHRAMEGLR